MSNQNEIQKKEQASGRPDTANYIKAMRAKTGMSQRQFAEFFPVPIPVRSLQEWEQGKRTPPDYVVGMMERIIEIDLKVK